MWELIPSFIIRNEDHFHRSAVSVPCILLYEQEKIRIFLQFFGTYDVDDDAVAAAGGQLPPAGGLLLGSMSTSMGTPASVETGRA